MRDRNDYSYTIKFRPGESWLKWAWVVYYKGERLGDGHTQTRWGARQEAGTVIHYHRKYDGKVY